MTWYHLYKIIKRKPKVRYFQALNFTGDQIFIYIEKKIENNKKCRRKNTEKQREREKYLQTNSATPSHFTQ